MRKSIRFSLFVAACSICMFANNYSLSAIDLSRYLPDRIADFNAQGPATIENANQDGATFQRTQRLYISSKPSNPLNPLSPISLCVIAILDGDGVTDIIQKTFSKGAKMKISNHDAVSVSESNNMVSASVKTGPQQMVTVIVLNTQNTEVPISLLKELDLNEMSTLNMPDKHEIIYKGESICGGRQLEVSFVYDTSGSTIKNFKQVHSCVKEINDGRGTISEQVHTPLSVTNNRFSSSLVAEGFISSTGKASGKILGQMQSTKAQCSDGKFYQNCTDWVAEPQK